MNNLKQKWKDFIKWFVKDQGYANLRIERCEISQSVFYGTNRRHDVDNTVPKFIIDGFVESGMIVDDDFHHVTKLTMDCSVDANHPRTELRIKVFDYNYADNVLLNMEDGTEFVQRLKEAIFAPDTTE